MRCQPQTDDRGGRGSRRLQTHWMTTEDVVYGTVRRDDPRCPGGILKYLNSDLGRQTVRKDPMTIEMADAMDGLRHRSLRRQRRVPEAETNGPPERP